MRDRLADLKAAATASDEEDGGMVVSVDRGGYMQDFFRKVEAIRSILEKLSSQVFEVKKKHSTILSAPNPDEQTKDELEQLSNEIKKNAKTVQSKLKSIKDSLPQDSSHASVNVRIQRTQHAVLSRKFVEVMSEYNDIQVSFRERSKNRIQRQLEITGKRTTNEDLEEMLESGNPSIFTCDIISDSQITRQALDEIESRHKDIMKLESSIRELHDMFMDIAVLVQMQGETLENIENNVSSAVDYVEGANMQLRRAERYQQSIRKKYVIVAIIVVIIILLIALISSLSVGFSSKTTSTTNNSG